MNKIENNYNRDKDQELAALNLIKMLGFTKLNNNFQISADNSVDLELLIEHGLKQMKKLGQVEVTASFKRLIKGTNTQMSLKLGIQLKENFLDLDISGEGLSEEDIDAILQAYQEKRHYFVLKNGQIQKIDLPSVDELAKIMKSLGIDFDKFVKGKLSIPAYRAFYLDNLLKKRDNLEFTSNDAFKNLIQDLENGTQKKAVIPKEVKDILRPYQVSGFQWLNTVVDYNLGGLLADEMGLGKTLQTISLILAQKEKSALPSLVIAPASVVYNWENEIKKFAPDLVTLTLGGTKAEREGQLSQANEADVLITSYDSLKRDLGSYEKLQFNIEILDEAQNIKNIRTEATKAVKVINANHRIALTGTPIENNLSELWSIFDYLMPGFLDDYKLFKENYEKPIVKDENKDIEKKLSQIIAPFILRRLKKNVVKDLPSKEEKIAYVNLSGKQEKLYDAQVQDLLAKLTSQDDSAFKKERFLVLAAITKLRELCCDPHLLYDNYRGKSAKLVETLSLIKDSIEDGHKILLFSQFTSMLDIIEKQLQKLEIGTFMITGITQKQKRQELIQEFNNLDHPAVFLISLKAGGTGINLTSADVVIHYDPWWNVAAENQATDRAHRIGQQNSVTIYKMVAKNTIEERIIDLQQKKSKLAEAVLSGESIGSSSLNKDDLINILER